MFWENEYGRKALQNMINIFEKKTPSINSNNNNKTDIKQRITLPKIELKIKKEIQKFGYRVLFQTDPNLQNILCKNKSRYGVQELKC